MTAPCATPHATTRRVSAQVVRKKDIPDWAVRRAESQAPERAASDVSEHGAAGEAAGGGKKRLSDSGANSPAAAGGGGGAWGARPRN